MISDQPKENAAEEKENYNTRVIIRAQELLDNIAQGKDPYTEESFKDGQILKHERVKKMCAYGASLLKRVLEEKGVAPGTIYVFKSAEIRNEEEAVRKMAAGFKSLQNGINPFDNCAAAENDPLGDKKLSKLFGFLAETFENMKFNKRPFFITEEQLEDFEYSDEPLMFKDIKQRVDALIDSDVYYGISAPMISEYLVGIQMLEEITTSNGQKKYRKPSPMGKKLGIIQEEYESSGYRHYRLKYSRTMQEFIIRNLPTILERFRNRKITSNADNGEDSE